MTQDAHARITVVQGILVDIKLALPLQSASYQMNQWLMMKI
jgi:hypothetical protein